MASHLFSPEQVAASLAAHALPSETVSRELIAAAGGVDKLSTAPGPVSSLDERTVDALLRGATDTQLLLELVAHRGATSVIALADNARPPDDVVLAALCLIDAAGFTPSSKFISTATVIEIAAHQLLTHAPLLLQLRIAKNTTNRVFQVASRHAREELSRSSSRHNIDLVLAAAEVGDSVFEAALKNLSPEQVADNFSAMSEKLRKGRLSGLRAMLTATARLDDVALDAVDELLANGDEHLPFTSTVPSRWEVSSPAALLRLFEKIDHYPNWSLSRLVLPKGTPAVLKELRSLPSEHNQRWLIALQWWEQYNHDEEALFAAIPLLVEHRPYDTLSLGPKTFMLDHDWPEDLRPLVLRACSPAQVASLALDEVELVRTTGPALCTPDAVGQLATSAPGLVQLASALLNAHTLERDLTPYLDPLIDALGQTGVELVVNSSSPYLTQRCAKELGTDQEAWRAFCTFAARSHVSLSFVLLAAKKL